MKEQNADCAGAAVARDGAPGARDADFLKVLILADGFLRRLDDFLWNAGVRDEDAAQVQVFFPLQAVGKISQDFMTIYAVIIAFYFGTQSQKTQDAIDSAGKGV